MRRSTWWLRLLAQVNRALPGGLRFPDRLLDRVRWLFLTFALLIYAIAAAFVPLYPGLSLTERVVAEIAIVGLGVWAVPRYLGHLGGFFPDLVPPVALALVGWSTQTGNFVIPLAFSSMLFHALYGTTLLTVFKVVHYLFAIEASLLWMTDDPLGVTPNTVSNVLVFVAIAAVMRVLLESLERQAQRSDHEQLLADTGRELLSARRTADIHAAAAHTARALLDDPSAVVSVWRRDQNEFTPLRVESRQGDLTLAPVSADEFPERARSRMRRGHPHVIGVDLSRRFYDRFGLDYRGETVVVIPLSVQEAMMGALVLSRSTSIDDVLLDVLRRFGIEISLALERTEAMERLGEYAHDLQVANRQLRRANQVKDNFLSSVSHELRTPLTAIAGFADTLLNRWDHLGRDDARRFVAIIERHATRQRRLVDDLLMITRLQAQAVEPRSAEVELRDLAVDVIAEVAAEVRDVVLEAPGETKAWADPDHVARILTNLLTNAAKYGAPPIEVQIPVPLPGEPVTVRVVDHGPGVDEAFLPRLFSRFEQASSGDTRSSTGVGLGLSISRELARRNDGDLHYEPTPGGGATFIVGLPQVKVVRHPSSAVSPPLEREERTG